MKFIYDVRVLRCTRFKNKTMSNPPIRKVMDYEFDFCIGCDREMWLDGKNYKLDHGCFVIRKPGQMVYTKGIYDCYMLTLEFSHRLIPKNYSRNTATTMQPLFESEIWDVLPSVFHPYHYEDYVRIFEALISINEIDLNENNMTPILINELLFLIISDAYLDHSPIDNNKTPMDYVCSYIKKHFMEEINLNQLGSIAHCNKNYLVRQFKKKYGIAPISYLIKIRMDYAKKLLTESKLPVKSIAIECGYNDPVFFNAYFKKTFQISPTNYRRLQQVNVTPPPDNDNLF